MRHFLEDCVIITNAVSMKNFFYKIIFSYPQYVHGVGHRILSMFNIFIELAGSLS